MQWCAKTTLLPKVLFSVTVNPFGISYNPVSLATSLERIIKGTPYSEKDLG